MCIYLYIFLNLSFPFPSPLPFPSLLSFPSHVNSFPGVYGVLIYSPREKKFTNMTSTPFNVVSTNSFLPFPQTH